MGFDIYRIQPLEENRFALHRVGPLALGGPKGFLAGHLPAMATQNEQWSLTPQELLGWVNVTEHALHGIFFDLTPGSTEQVNLLELVHVSGRTVSLITDALFHFKVACVSRKPTELRGAEGEWIIKDWQARPTRFEQLRLEGGTRGGNWGWSEPPQSASATVL